MTPVQPFARDLNLVEALGGVVGALTQHVQQSIIIEHADIVATASDKPPAVSGSLRPSGYKEKAAASSGTRPPGQLVDASWRRLIV
ncbi:hypothetical protein Pth03_74860 [Planotetraspora thailandica]|uniref:Uncharacterized protein n=1 Tax=Planotetraspora thailandica TaxID=487172 RepID=A0A8J3Y1M5_9ACTN|nr:hypothetical protein Pth03_74860 [Planotetraspora thailandica]